MPNSGTRVRVLDVHVPGVECEPPVQQKAYGGEEGQEDRDEHLADAHAHVVEVLLNVDDFLPDVDGLLAALGRECGLGRRPTVTVPEVKQP